MCNLRKSTGTYSYCLVSGKICSCKTIKEDKESACRDTLYNDLCSVLNGRIIQKDKQ